VRVTVIQTGNRIVERHGSMMLDVNENYEQYEKKDGDKFSQS